jgi:cell wall-associated NlpC family hydrolase
MSRSPRVLAVLCALAASLAVALLKPLGGRAAVGNGASVTGDAVATTQPLAGTRTRTLAASRRFGVRVVDYAKRFLGVRYAYGGVSPASGFDCSGFVRFVYAHFGVSLPHSSYAQFDDGRRIGRASLRPGDLVFFDSVGHVGIYVGNDRFIHAPHTGTRVRIESFAGWYSSRFSGARRLTTTA